MVEMLCTTSVGHTRVVELLLAADANPHIKNSKAWTAVHSGASGGHFEAVLRLVQNGAAWRNSTDCNVLKTICRKTSYKCVQTQGMPAAFRIVVEVYCTILYKI